MNTPTVKTEDDVVNMVLAIAHENGEQLRAMYLHCVCIKGRGRLGILTTTAFRCESRLDAIAVAEEFGDSIPPEMGHAMPEQMQ